MEEGYECGSSWQKAKISEKKRILTKLGTILIRTSSELAKENEEEEKQQRENEKNKMMECWRTKD